MPMTDQEKAENVALMAKKRAKEAWIDLMHIGETAENTTTIRSCGVVLTVTLKRLHADD